MRRMLHHAPLPFHPKIIVLCGYHLAGCSLGGQFLAQDFSIPVGETGDVVWQVYSAFFNKPVDLLQKGDHRWHRDEALKMKAALLSMDPGSLFRACVYRGCGVVVGLREQNELDAAKEWIRGQYWCRKNKYDEPDFRYHLHTVWVHRPVIPADSRHTTITADDCEEVIVNLHADDYRAALHRTAKLCGYEPLSLGPTVKQKIEGWQPPARAKAKLIHNTNAIA